MKFPLSINMIKQQAHFVWDEKCDWFQIRCLEDDKDYIMNEYLKAQSEMENELVEKDVIQACGNLIPIVKNDLIGALQPSSAVLDESDEPPVAVSTERVDIEYSDRQGRVEKIVERRAESEDKAYLF